MALVVFRADSSTQIGSGHLRRCLTLARSLKQSGAQIYFICQDLPGNLSHLVTESGFQLFLIPDKKDSQSCNDILTQIGHKLDWIIVDHYGLDETFETPLRKYTHRIMVIDDLADRKHDCDLLLDQNFYQNKEGRYAGKVPSFCQTLLGTRYVLLREEFGVARQNIRKRSGSVEQVLLFFGGMDPQNETLKVLQAIKLLDRPELNLSVVIGGTNSHLNKIENWCKNHPRAKLHIQTQEIAQLMLEADLFLGAGGAVTWERCCLGLPALIITTAENQVKVAQDLADLNCHVYLGSHTEVTSQSIAQSIQLWTQDPEGLTQMGERGLDLVDGRGVSRVVEAIMQNGIK